MQKIALTLFASLCFHVTSHAALPFEQLLYKGRAIAFYNQSTDSSQQKYIDAIKQSQLAERMANIISGSLMIKSDIGIGFESCGEPNALFNPQRGAIILCSEFIELIVKIARNDKEFVMQLPKDAFAAVIDGLIWGVFLHELAHAVIYTNNIPVTGREEDVADQFTVWFSVNFIDPNQTPIVLPSIWFWSKLAKERDLISMSEQERQHFMSNEHSLDAQRVYNMACWVLGTGADHGAKTAQYARLPNERAQRCTSEYTQMDLGMKKNFKKYFKVRPLRGAW